LDLHLLHAAKVVDHRLEGDVDRALGGRQLLAVVAEAETDTPHRRAKVIELHRQVPLAAADPFGRFRDLEKRLQRLETYVTSSRFKLDREFRDLRE
jgi:hypothetical protein